MASRKKRRSPSRSRYRLTFLGKLALAFCLLLMVVLFLFVWGNRSSLLVQLVPELDRGLLASGGSEKAEPVAVTPPAPVSIDLVAVGDNLLHMGLVNQAKQSDGSYDFRPYYQPVMPLIESADLAVINQETILGGSAFPYSGYPQFNSPHAVGDALVDTGFDVILTANNHSMDKGYAGIEHTLGFWREKYPEIVTAGMNLSPEEQQNISLVEQNGITLAILNYTFSLNGIPLPKDHPYAVNLLEDRDLMVKHIAFAKQHADFTIVFPHWGEEYSDSPNSLQQDLTAFFAQQGVDLIIGSHPHVLQPVEWISPEGTPRTPEDPHVEGDMLVYYSLGNFLSQQNTARRMLGGMATVTLQKTEAASDGSSPAKTSITKAGLIPLVTHLGPSNTYRVYPLSDYTPELASKHTVRTKDQNLTLDFFEQHAEKIVGTFLQAPASESTAS